MSRKVFDYNGLTKIGLESPYPLIKRISENLESEIENDSKTDCSIKINQKNPAIEIVKDKRFDYLTLNKKEENKKTLIEYRRYNTLIRKIHQDSTSNYVVDTNISLDESAGLICIRNHLSNNQSTAYKPLVHASLVEMGGQGVLIPGNSRNGKTTLLVYLLQEKDAIFISDENVILDSSNNQTRGLYVPRTPRIRFSTISESRLSEVLNDVSLTRATQYIDSDAIERIIESKTYQADAGLAFSRKSFCELLGATSKESALVNIVLFPKYTLEKKVIAKTLTNREGIHRLEMAGLAKKTEISPRELSKSFLNLSQESYSKTKFIEICFSNFRSLLSGSIKL